MASLSDNFKTLMSLEKQQLKTVVITGGGTGIGYETAKLLIETKQYRIALVGRNKSRLDEAAQELGGGDLVTAWACDLRDSAQIKKTVEKIAATHKGIFGLVNNAGIYPFGGVANTSEATWDEAMDVNLKGPFLMIQAVVPFMSKSRDGGRIVNVSSTAGILPNHFALAYSVSKAALLHLTRTLAKELGPSNITVNCVCPGIVKSPLHEAYMKSENELEEFYAKRGATFPLGRVGEPRDVAGPIRYFLSDDAAWVTGDVFIADGGRLLL
jgi:NAD(P)-dependent dehydrogenase (short-subunit alcohol dehydrogenase family)